MLKIKNPLIQGFLKEEENYSLFKKYQLEPTQKNEQKLDNKFKKYYLKIRAISYFSKVIHFESKKFDNKHRTYNKRFLSILDKPAPESDNGTLIDLLVDSSTNYCAEEVPSKNLEDYIENPSLYLSIKKLSSKQKKILYLAYIKDLKDVEIARYLNVSQQYITRTRNKTLLKLRRDLSD
ncbi:sigma-70 family RNA polymerase sigma factor [Priestia megaterium]|uniref:sigma-70 family RNA polymerase sigma factor n=1 Tax=Priestia megaterium TaxID=1404 RepID=UPI0030001773